MFYCAKHNDSNYTPHRDECAECVINSCERAGFGYALPENAIPPLFRKQDSRKNKRIQARKRLRAGRLVNMAFDAGEKMEKQSNV